MQYPVLVRTNFDPSIHKWVATSDDIKGLSVAAQSIRDLKVRLPKAISTCLGKVENNALEKAVRDGKLVSYQIVLGTSRHAPMNVLVQRNIRLIEMDETVETPTQTARETNRPRRWWSGITEFYHKVRFQKDHASSAFGYGALTKSGG